MRDILLTLNDTETGIAFYPEENTVTSNTQINFVIGNNLYKYINNPNIYVIFLWNGLPQRLTAYSSLTFFAGITNDTYALLIVNPNDDSDLSDTDLNNIVKNYETTADKNGEIIVRD
jgi:hypothetical protein